MCRAQVAVVMNWYCVLGTPSYWRTLFSRTCENGTEHRQKEHIGSCKWSELWLKTSAQACNHNRELATCHQGHTRSKPSSLLHSFSSSCPVTCQQLCHCGDSTQQDSG